KGLKMIDVKVLKNLSKIHVLIVEDDELTAYALRQSLGKYCRQVDVAVDGMQGFEMFENNKPDIIISDINLPEMNGLEMINAIHEISPHTPVIIITSYNSTENISESIKQGAYSYLLKPISVEELQTVVLLATKDMCHSEVILENGFVYDKDSKLLKDPNQKIVALTRREGELINLLISNIDKTIEYSTIESYVWEDKSMSIEALRMRIKKIRQKTYSEIIENISGCGYRINTPK
ncbi:MAG: two-component system response regulator MprA, partial [Sulfurimonas sp.]